MLYPVKEVGLGNMSPRLKALVKISIYLEFPHFINVILIV